MKHVLKINNLNVGKFNNFNLEIKEQWTTIVGPSGSGKTTIVKAIAGIYKYDGEIEINGLVLNDKTKKSIYNSIGIVFENPDNLFFSDTIFDEIAFSLQNIGVAKNEIESKINKITSYFGFADILMKNPRELSGSEKQLLSIICAIIKEPKILIIDDGLGRLNTDIRQSVIKYIEKEEVSVIHLTVSGNININSSRIIILKDNQIIGDGDISIFTKEKLFNSLGVEIPFMLNLSNKLTHYELVDKQILDMEEMVDKIWK